MVNTELHNKLIDVEGERKLIEVKRVRQIAKTKLLIEKLKSILLVMGVVFIGLLLLLFLYWLFPNKIKTVQPQPQVIEKIIAKKLQELDCCNQNSTHTKAGADSTNSKQNKKTNIHGQTTPKDGIDYVKKNNHVYKRVWKNGELISEEQLKTTIEESRKLLHEKIPQFAAPKK